MGFTGLENRTWSKDPVRANGTQRALKYRRGLRPHFSQSGLYVEGAAHLCGMGILRLIRAAAGFFLLIPFSFAEPTLV